MSVLPPATAAYSCKLITSSGKCLTLSHFQVSREKTQSSRCASQKLVWPINKAYEICNEFVMSVFNDNRLTLDTHS